MNDKDRHNVIWLCQKHIFGIYVLQGSLQPVYLLVHFIFTRIFSQVWAQLMLHGSHTVSLRASSSQFRAAHSFFFPFLLSGITSNVFTEEKMILLENPSAAELRELMRLIVFFSLRHHKHLPAESAPFFAIEGSSLDPPKPHPGSISWYFQLRLRN